MYRVYRNGKVTKAWQHGNYIKHEYGDVWSMAESEAAEAHVSLSEFISHALYVFMLGREPPGWRDRPRRTLKPRSRKKA